MIAGKFKDARFRLITDRDCKAGREDMLCPDDKNHVRKLFILEIKATTAFCMSFIGELCSPVDAISVDDPDVQWFSDTQKMQSLWKDFSRHLSLNGEQLEIKDLGSTNGTIVNGNKIKKTIIHPDDVIDVGGQKFVVTLVSNVDHTMVQDVEADKEIALEVDVTR